MVCSKTIETEAVSTKIAINNVWGVNFSQNTAYVQKVSKLKQYLSR